MRTWRELTIASKSMDATALVDALRVFGSGERQWEFLEGQSTIAERDLGVPACVIAWRASEESDRLEVRLGAIEDKGVLQLTNVVSSCRNIDVDESNLIAGQFAKALRRWVKHSGCDLTVRLGSSDIGLEQLVSSGTARNLLQRYLDKCRWCGEIMKHPLDLELLDRFTCALHTYSRKPVNLCELQRYLVEDCQWSEDDARWCIRCIEIGRDVLRSYAPHLDERRPYQPPQ